jgi:2-oxo-4-hydroxy-4-carboxy-5-ureidoimidazoline decarboxylase
MDIQSLNTLPIDQANHLFLQCCTSEKWIEKMVASRPFTNRSSLRETADHIWGNLTEKDYLQAFEGHPKIGDVGSLKAKYANTKALASGEQSGANSATDEVIAELANSNSAYEEKYGFIFIVCATGKSATEMLALLQDRLNNDRQKELEIASEEQRKIFHLRLEKLL